MNNRVKCTADQRAHIASISKTFLAYLVMRAYERGELNFATPLQEYKFTEKVSENADISIPQLKVHQGPEDVSV